LVETVSMFRMRYVIEAKEGEHALDEVVMNTKGDYKETWQEMSQKHLDEVIVSSREISDKEYLKIFDEDNDYMVHSTKNEKRRFINKIDYKK